MMPTKEEFMPTKEEIILAIGAHIWWKNEFEKAVSEGWHFFNPELAERSSESELGLWLAELSAAGEASEHFEQVQSRYTDFHDAAATVVRLAASGNIDLAETNIRIGEYARAATALALALRDWMAAVKAPDYGHGLRTLPTATPNPNQESFGQ